MQKLSVKFYAKNANDDAYASFRYVGSVGVESTLRTNLIVAAESIGGEINGPLIAQIEGETDIVVLKI